MSQLVAKKCKYFSIFVLGKTSLYKERGIFCVNISTAFLYDPNDSSHS